VKLLLTSSGLTTDQIRQTLVDLLGRPIADCTAVHVPTAVYALAGGLGHVTEEAAPPGADDFRGLGLDGFHVRPHLNSEDFPDMNRAAMERAAAKVDWPLYAIDDRSAILVADGQVEVISDGDRQLFNAPEDDR
jgi:hypothetical protein